MSRPLTSPLPFFFTGAVSYSSSFLKIIRVVIIAHVDYGPQGTKFRRTDRPERNLFRRPLNWKCRRLQNICGKKNGIPNNRATSWITRNTPPSPKLFLEIKKMNTNSLSTKNSPKNLKSNVLCIILVIRYFYIRRGCGSCADKQPVNKFWSCDHQVPPVGLEVV